jgi:type I restriction enzyme S subunit
MAWGTRRFTEICKLRKGRKPELLADQTTHGMPYLTARFMRGTEAPQWVPASDPAAVIAKQADIIIICDGSNSGETFTGFSGVVSSTMAIVEHDHAISTEYLRFFLMSQVEKYAETKTGAAIPHLDLRGLRDSEVPLPALSEQQRIAAILDEAFAGIAKATANAEQNIANAWLLFDSVLNETFRSGGVDWQKGRLGDFVTVKHGFAFRSEFFTEKGEFILLTPGNFFERGGYRDRGAKQKFYKGPIPQGFTLNSNDLLVAMTEQAAGLLGSPLIVPKEGIFLHNQRLGLVQPKPGASFVPQLFEHLFNTHSFRARVHADGTGVKVRHTSPEKLSRVPVQVPKSVEAQHALAQKLTSLRDAAEHLENVQRSKLAAISKLRVSLLHRAFTGQLINTSAVAA